MLLPVLFYVCFTNKINQEILEGGYSDDGFWKTINPFNYTYLRIAFRSALLNEMQAILGPSFKKVKAKCYTEHKQGFYSRFIWL